MITKYSEIAFSDFVIKLANAFFLGLILQKRHFEIYVYVFRMLNSFKQYQVDLSFSDFDVKKI